MRTRKELLTSLSNFVSMNVPGETGKMATILLNKMRTFQPLSGVELQQVGILVDLMDGNDEIDFVAKSVELKKELEDAKLQIIKLNNKPAKIVEVVKEIVKEIPTTITKTKIVEVPVEKIVEKLITKVIEKEVVREVKIEMTEEEMIQALAKIQQEREADALLKEFEKELEYIRNGDSEEGSPIGPQGPRSKKGKLKRLLALYIKSNPEFMKKYRELLDKCFSFTTTVSGVYEIKSVFSTIKLSHRFRPTLGETQRYIRILKTNHLINNFCKDSERLGMGELTQEFLNLKFKKVL